MTEQEKRAAQTAFLSAENVRDIYRQVTEQGYFGKNLTRQITEEPTPEIDTPEIEPEVDVELER